MRVLIAFDKFRDSLRAVEACRIAAETLGSLHPDWQLDLCPLTDGGEGFCEILSSACRGAMVPRQVRDPLGHPVRAPLGLVSWDSLPVGARALLECQSSTQAEHRTLAILEMATASGLGLIDPRERNPWVTSTVGTGDLIRAASERGVDDILLGVGGSATIDLGLGALWALGLIPRFDPERSEACIPTPATWHDLKGFSGAVPKNLPRIHIACDVTNPLLGEHGATRCFGPQKGLPVADIPRLDALARRTADLLLRHCAGDESLLMTPGAGAAGGIAFGLLCAAGARLVPGAPLVSEWLELPRRIGSADLVITGEGCFDEGSLSGKGPGHLISLARSNGARLQVFTGLNRLATPPEGISVHQITPTGTPLQEALAQAPAFLSRSLSEIFR